MNIVILGAGRMGRLLAAYALDSGFDLANLDSVVASGVGAENPEDMLQTMTQNCP